MAWVVGCVGRFLSPTEDSIYFIDFVVQMLMIHQGMGITIPRPEKIFTKEVRGNPYPYLDIYALGKIISAAFNYN